MHPRRQQVTALPQIEGAIRLFHLFLSRQEAAVRCPRLLVSVECRIPEAAVYFEANIMGERFRDHCAVTLWFRIGSLREPRHWFFMGARISRHPGSRLPSGLACLNVPASLLRLTSSPSSKGRLRRRLLECRPHHVAGSFGCESARIWKFLALPC